MEIFYFLWATSKPIQNMAKFLQSERELAGDGRLRKKGEFAETWATILHSIHRCFKPFNYYSHQSFLKMSCRQLHIFLTGKAPIFELRVDFGTEVGTIGHWYVNDYTHSSCDFGVLKGLNVKLCNTGST